MLWEWWDWEREYYNTGPLKLFSDLKWRVELECVGRGEGGVW